MAKDQRDIDVENFEKYAARTRAVLNERFDKTSGWIDEALEEAGAQLEKAGELTKAESEKAREFLKKDLEATKDDFEKAGDALSKALNPSRVGSGVMSLTHSVLSTLGERFSEWAKRSEGALTYTVGEITSPGTLTCTSCGSTMEYTKSGRVPPCPKCKAGEFRKSY